MLLISGRAAGSRKPLFADWSIPLPPDDYDGEGGMSLRDLIEKVVRAELAAFEQHRQARTLDRVMTREQIDEGAAKGKVSPEGRDSPPAPPAEVALAVAFQAFEDGLYLVAIDAGSTSASMNRST